MSSQPLFVASSVVVALIPLQVRLVSLRASARGHVFPTAEGMRPAGVGSLAQRADTLQFSPSPFRRTIT